jgi:hypothetical protein
MFVIDFDKLSWTTALPGMRMKVHQDGLRQVRLVELTREFSELDWCEKAHTGIVLLGDLEIDFQGRRVTCPQGTGIMIPGGSESAHRVRALTPLVRLFLVEELSAQSNP